MWTAQIGSKSTITRVLSPLCSTILMPTSAAVVEMECGVTSAWHHGGAKLVQEEAPRRLKTSGWTAVRFALSTTVRYALLNILLSCDVFTVFFRYWIMRGFYQGSMGDSVAGIEFYRRALDVLEWGSREWKGVPRSDCGVIFELSFIRSVRRLYLDELMRVGASLHCCSALNIDFL